MKKLGEYKNRPIVSGDNKRYKHELTKKQLVELLGGSSVNSPELEGDYYLAKPNGYYWKYVGPKTVSKDSEMYGKLQNFALIQSIQDNMYRLVSSDGIENDHYFSVLIFLSIFGSKNTTNEINMNDFVAFSEKNITKTLEGVILPNEMSFYESMLFRFGISKEEMPEESFEAMILENYSMQRITKEEYESLITAQ